MKVIKIYLTIVAVLILLLAGLLSYASSQQEIVLTRGNHAELVTGVNGEVVDKVITTLRSLDKSKPRYLYINSPGGEVITGIRLISFLQSSEGKGIICVADIAASMAFVAVQACETRIATPNAIFMSHGISGGAQGNVRKIESDLKLMKGLEYILDRLSALRIGITVEELKSRQNDEYWIIGAEALIKDNIVDKISKVTCGEDLTTPVEVDGTDDEGKPSKVQKILCPL